jgi:hypothetical protein
MTKDGKVDGYIGEFGETQEWPVRARGRERERRGHQNLRKGTVGLE